MKRMNVKQHMSKQLVSVSWDLPIEDAAELMETNRFRHLPVTDDLGVVVGILSDRDINRAMSPCKPGFMGGSTTGDYMTWPVITVDQQMTLKEAAEGMIDQKISALLVTDQAKEIIGIVTSEDLLKALVCLLSAPAPITLAKYSPVIGEFLREVQASGL